MFASAKGAVLIANYAILLLSLTEFGAFDRCWRSGKLAPSHG
jgi:hypothetical protein